ncbi:zinc ribbon domain-containing protein [Arthrobacter sp. 24S4-2]|uniref:zinc ribbon domain-containing protein n=1 Tax=Arthrobacter sp. 24S4-2 TaxID=2575374 RepID=UPI0010C777AB|nr:zinc ribbon domain-containing protein [Arthrobacter sp. 24S4-2]QCO97573.1 zinc ribbon domain-containing protein [Arthrobacter sp. 24S4-2]
MTHNTERCQRCQQLIRPGASFCPACGAPLTNRAARNVRNIDHSQKELMDRAAAHGGPIPGSIPVAPARTETVREGAHGRGAALQGSQEQGVHVQGEVPEWAASWSWFLQRPANAWAPQCSTGWPRQRCLR